MRPSKSHLACSILLSLWLPSVAPAVSEERVEQSALVDRAIAQHGGEAYGHTETSLDICSKSGCFHVETRTQKDRFDFKVAGKASGRHREVSSVGGLTTVKLDGETIAVDGTAMQRHIDWAMARIYFCFLPYRLNDPGVYKQDLGLTDWGGRTFHRIKVTFEPGSSTDASDEYMYWFDPETARLEFFAYTYDDNGGGLRFRRAINHRRFGGILFFDQENFGTEGAGLSVDLIDEAFVRNKLRHVSTVRLEDIEVRSSR